MSTNATIKGIATRMLVVERKPASEVAKTLGIAPSTLTRWKKQIHNNAFARIIDGHNLVLAGDVDRGLRAIRAGLAAFGKSPW